MFVVPIFSLIQLGPEKKRKDVLDWLYPDSVDEKHNEISSRRQKDTGNWLLESKQFRELETGVPEILWGYGIRKLNQISINV